MVFRLLWFVEMPGESRTLRNEGGGHRGVENGAGACLRRRRVFGRHPASETRTGETGERRGLGSDEAFLALASLYGVEIQADNVAACRRRLLDIFRPWALDIADEHTAAWILGWNIVQGDFLKGADMDGAPIMFNVYAIRNGKFAVIGRERLFPPGQEPVRAMEPYRRKRRKA